MVLPLKETCPGIGCRLVYARIELITDISHPECDIGLHYSERNFPIVAHGSSFFHLKVLESTIIMFNVLASKYVICDTVFS